MKRSKLIKILALVLSMSLLLGSISVTYAKKPSPDPEPPISTTTTVDHIDIKAAVAVTESDEGTLDNVSVYSITYVGYKENATDSFTDVFSGTDLMGTANEVRYTGLSFDAASSELQIKIEGTFDNGESFSVTFDNSSVYPEDTYYPVSGDDSADLATFYGITAVDGYYDISGKNIIEVASATEKIKVTLSLDKELYSLYYEICEGDEVYYRFTFVNTNAPIEPQYLMDDPWGRVKGKYLKIGVF